MACNTQKETFGHLLKVSSRKSLHSPSRLIENDAFRFSLIFFFFCFEQVFFSTKCDVVVKRRLGVCLPTSPLPKSPLPTLPLPKSPLLTLPLPKSPLPTSSLPKSPLPTLPPVYSHFVSLPFRPLPICPIPTSLLSSVAPFSSCPFPSCHFLIHPFPFCPFPVLPLPHFAHFPFRPFPVLPLMLKHH